LKQVLGHYFDGSYSRKEIMEGRPNEDKINWGMRAHEMHMQERDSSCGLTR